MEGTRVTALEEITSGFVRWLDRAVPTLTAFNAVDQHIDELYSEGLSPQAQVDRSIELFGWVLTNLAGRLAGKVVMLMVPLRNSAILDTAPPGWTSLASQLSSTPPSIYIMEVSAFLQADPAHRYITPVDVPGLAEEPVAAYYRCWRNPDDPEEEGWSRDVYVVSLHLLRP